MTGPSLGSERESREGLFAGFVRWTLWPASMAAATILALGAVSGASTPMTWWALLWSTPLLLVLAEQWFPAIESWKPTLGDVLTDSAHLIAQLVAGYLAVISIFVVVSPAATELAVSWGGYPWPRDWPLLAQLVLGVGIAEFFYYWYHRLAHKSSLLWRFHAVHHSCQKLNWWSAARHHPVDIFLNVVCNLAPLVLLGAEVVVLFLWYTLIAFHVRLQHCNLPLRHGVLGWIVNSVEIHRLHHARATGVSNANYGNMLIIWDWVFGTRCDAPQPDALGLEADERYPQRFWGQLAAPFMGQPRS